jgi:hypothetical protein
MERRQIIAVLQNGYAVNHHNLARMASPVSLPMADILGRKEVRQFAYPLILENLKTVMALA